MSKIRAAAEMMKNLPGRGAPGGLVSPNRFGAMPLSRDLSRGEMLGITTGLGLGGGLGVSDLTEGFTEPANLKNSIFADPEQLGRETAKLKMTIQQVMDMVKGKAEELGEAPQIYMLKVQNGYQDEMNKQEPQRVYDEDIYGGAKPVSLLFSGGGEASSQHMMPDGTPMPGSNHQEYEAMMMQQRQMMAGGGTPFPDLNNDGKRTYADVLVGRGVEFAEGGEAIGDELEGMEMTEEQAMAELEESRGEFEQLQMLADVVKKLLNEGMGEAEIVSYLKEQGLDDEDIETLFSFLQEMSGQEAVIEQQGAGQIDQQLQGMM